MSAFVVDASVVVKWFVPEVQSLAARRWLDAPHDYLAPELIFPEAANAIYLTLAVRLETQLVTGDDRLARKLADHPLLAPHVRTVEDFVSE